MQINIADQSVINRILQRKRKGGIFSHEVDLSAVLKEIMKRANDFVPSESGSILLDDPTIKSISDKGRRLYFLACFGEGSDGLVGTHLPDDVGIVGETYQSGKSYLSRDVKKDDKFYDKIDETTKFQTRSLIAIPIEIDGSTIGVIELINRKNRENYDKKDQALLEIFAGYTSTLIQNALDARKFEELSKIDNLTGIHNDRYFYEMLSQGVYRSVNGGGDISLIFFDLDHFKEVNDTHGHLSGSRVLKEVARLMEDVFDGVESILARYGGDEYVVLLPGINLDEAGRLAETLRETIEKNVFLKESGSLDDPPLNISGLITCSVGVASLHNNVERRERLREMEEELIKAADVSMYQAKDLGKNRVVVASGKIP